MALEWRASIRFFKRDFIDALSYEYRQLSMKIFAKSKKITELNQEGIFQLEAEPVYVAKPAIGTSSIGLFRLAATDSRYMQRENWNTKS